jgi:hypothetical protein
MSVSVTGLICPKSLVELVTRSAGQRRPLTSDPFLSVGRLARHLDVTHGLFGIALEDRRLRNLAVYAVHKLTDGPRLALLSSFDQLFSNPTQPDVGAFGIESDESTVPRGVSSRL